MLRRFKQLIHEQEFKPGIFLGILINPFFFSRFGLNSVIRDYSGFVNGKTLDAGCGTKPYREFFSEVDEYIGMEIDQSKNRLGNRVDVYYSGSEFPFPDSTFDSVVTFQVLEHVPDPEFFIGEIHRVLKPGGVLLLTAPFAWEQHEEPFDFTRFSEYGIQSRLKKYGFEMIRYQKVCRGLKAAVQMTTAMLTVHFLKSSKPIRWMVQLGIVFPFHCFGILLAGLFPKNDRLFLDNAVLAKKTV